MKVNTNYTFYSIVIFTKVFDLRLIANRRDNSQYCWPPMSGFVASVCTWRKVWAISNFAQQLPTTSNNMQQSAQTDATCSIQQCRELLAKNVASVCTGLDFYRNISNREPLFDNFDNNEKTLFILTMSILISTDFNYSCLHIIHVWNIDKNLFLKL